MNRLTLILLPLLLLLGACHGRHYRPIQRGAEVIISEGHHHSRYCGHYRVGTRWFFLARHRHGIDCGHRISDDGHYWELVDRD